MLSALSKLDGSALVWIQKAFDRDFLTPVMKFITHLGEYGILWIAIALFLFCIRQTRKTGILAMTSIGLNFLVNNVILKNLVARTRPYEIVQGVQLLIERQTDFSFPSGHTGAAFACTMVLFLTLPKKFGIPCIGFAALMGFTRLYLGVHYPTDVIAGALIGIIIAVAVVKAGTIVVQKAKERKAT